MKMTSTGNYGDMKTSATFEQGKLYRISFKAKTEGLEENAEVPISLIFDRYTNKDPGTTEVIRCPTLNIWLALKTLTMLRRSGQFLTIGKNFPAGIK